MLNQRVKFSYIKHFTCYHNHSYPHYRLTDDREFVAEHLPNGDRYDLERYEEL